MSYPCISKVMAATAAAGFFGVSAPAAAADMKVATVNMQRAVGDTNEGARAVTSLKTLFEKRQVELDGKRTQLGKDKTELDRKCQTRAMPKEQCDKSLDELSRKNMEMQNLAMEYQTELQKKQGEAVQPIVTKMLAVVRRIAQRDGFDLVVDQGVAHYQRTDTDLTDLAIKMYNAESNVPAAGPPGKAPAGGAKAPAQKAPAQGAAPQTPPAPPTVGPWKK